MGIWERTSKFILCGLLCTVAMADVSAKSPRCKVYLDTIDERLRTTGNLVLLTTTGRRGEIKAIVTSLRRNRFEKEAIERFGDKLQPRDPIPDGREAVNVSRYYPVLVEKGTGKKFEVRERDLQIKKTGARFSQSESIELTSGHKFLELKIEGKKKKEKRKLRVLFSKADLKEMFQSLEHFREIRSRVAENAKKVKIGKIENPPEMIEELLDKIDVYLGILQLQSVNIAQVLVVRYIRKSYRLLIPHPDTAQDPIDIQITFDRSIQYLDPQSGEVIGRYPKDYVVIEVKVPLELSDFLVLPFNDAVFAQIPDLYTLRELILSLKANAESHGKVDNAEVFIHSQE